MNAPRSGRFRDLLAGTCFACLGDRKAAAALEFVAVVPVLVLFAAGMMEFCIAIRVQLAVNQAARAVANLIAQQSGVTTAELNDYYYAGKDCFSFGSNNFTISAASLTFSAGSNSPAKAWDANSVSGSYVASPSNVTTLAQGLGAYSGGQWVGGDSVIVVHTSGAFSMPVNFGGLLPSSFTFTSNAFVRPRVTFKVSLN